MTRMLLALLLTLTASAARAADPPVDFSRDVLPVLSDYCFQCHGPDPNARKAQLRLDTKEGAFRTRNGVTVVSPGRPADSELVARVTSTDPDLVMPPPALKRRPSGQEIATLERWVEQAATWGRHWAFDPMSRPAVPAIANHKSAIMY